MKNIIIKPSTYDTCLASSEAIVDTTYPYLSTQRNQNNKKKVVEDHLIGKVGECAYVNHVYSQGKTCTLPDFEVYGNKSFNRDIEFEGKKIHVKCQPSWSYAWTCRETGGPSWACQPEDKLTSNPEENDYIALLSQVSKYEYRYHGTIQAKLLKDKWKAPLKGSLNKKCLYFKDFEEHVKL